MFREVEVNIPATPDRTETRRVYVQNGNKPVAEEGDITETETYNPDNLERIKAALESVTEFRSNLGATQNRLEHAYNNNRNTEENTQAAESRIRDTDMSKEMVNLTMQKILEQAGQMILAQAQQSKQGVLSLLQ